MAVSDKAELDRVKTGFCTKKLELDSNAADKAVAAAADDMKEERAEDRVAFYYLVAKARPANWTCLAEPSASPQTAGIP